MGCCYLTPMTTKPTATKQFAVAFNNNSPIPYILYSVRVGDNEFDWDVQGAEGLIPLASFDGYKLLENGEFVT